MTRPGWTCHHNIPGGCAYCRAIEIADEGPDGHTGRAAHNCPSCSIRRDRSNDTQPMEVVT